MEIVHEVHQGISERAAPSSPPPASPESASSSHAPPTEAEMVHPGQRIGSRAAGPVQVSSSIGIYNKVTCY